MLKKLLFIALATPLIGCSTTSSEVTEAISEPLVSEEAEIVNLLQQSPYHAESMWLEQESKIELGAWDKVILIFGWPDDSIECGLIQQLYTELYEDANYRCTPVK